MSAVYTPMAPQELLLEMAQEKVLQDAETFSDWLHVEVMEPADLRHSRYFADISTLGLLVEVLMKPKATPEQIVEAWKEVRRRYLFDEGDKVDAEFLRLLAEEQR